VLLCCITIQSCRSKDAFIMSCWLKKEMFSIQWFLNFLKLQIELQSKGMVPTAWVEIQDTVTSVNFYPTYQICVNHRFLNLRRTSRTKGKNNGQYLLIPTFTLIRSCNFLLIIFFITFCWKKKSSLNYVQ
jgi:hypothetical protein